MLEVLPLRLLDNCSGGFLGSLAYDRLSLLRSSDDLIGDSLGGLQRSAHPFRQFGDQLVVGERPGLGQLAFEHSYLSIELLVHRSQSASLRRGLP